VDRLIASKARRIAAPEQRHSADGRFVAEDPAASPRRIGTSVKSGEEESAQHNPPDVEKCKAPRPLAHVAIIAAA
jgi:hypothetical protein